MCGIYGSTLFYSNEIIAKKMDITKFRGPDYSCFERFGDVVLGHNRLAIVDLDSRSNQPFSYQHIKIVFNGEIYNYIEIRSNLKKLGYGFRTNSDTEVIGAAFLAYGKNCVNYFNGMFAFVIYDTRTQQLFGARDRLGKKPFYYAHCGKDFEFASQPTQISYGRKVTTDLQAINEYFIWGYIPEPRSIWVEIKKLPAGNYFYFDLSSGIFETNRYWDLDYQNENKFLGDYQAALQQLDDLVTDAVGIRMHADVDLGIFLSGGIDSSLIAAMAKKQTEHVNTFCVKFKEQGFDESNYACAVAKQLGTQHHTIECSASDGINLIASYADFYDEPFADPSAIPTLLLNKYTKKHVTVALGGDGGDECFMGYKRYQWLNWTNLLFNYPLPLRKLMAIPLKISTNYRHRLMGEGICQKNMSTLYAYMLGGLTYDWLLKPETGLEVSFMDIWSGMNASFLKKMSAFDIKTYLNGDINTKVDRGSMSFAIEARSPLMDYRIVEFALSLPDQFKLNGNVQKRILKDLLYRYVPSNFFNRPKSGFSVPLRHWLKNDLKPYVLEMLSPDELKTIPCINPIKTSLMIGEHLNGKANNSVHIWKLLAFKQWQKKQNAESSDYRQFISTPTPYAI
ncbi:MAG: asparagine synthase (glutamine-hydrolyzing) [Pedobacter sp.]|nr:MAG: asparagine synthase (glutamine-hydrolyzing) [Pedobacter sp.]